jgi:Cft2 family RNA processing exonuclease
MTPLDVEASSAGLYLPALDLWLDPAGDVPAAFVSHAHADHARGRSRVALGSRETLALVETRRGAAVEGARVVPWDGVVDWPMVSGGAARLAIAPAGHVLGAAQLVVDHPGGRFVYTGDYQSGGATTHAAGAPLACDDLVVESTYALPIFRFPDRAATMAALVAWCAERLDSGESPVVVAYALGKSQEIARACADAGLAVVAHGATYKACVAYESLGVDVGVARGAVRPYAEAKEKGDLGGVLLAPPGSGPMFRKRKGARVAYVSGWALLDAAVERQRADAAFVLSDHADHDDLMATVRASGAKRVRPTHGDAGVLAELLRLEGFDATPLELPALDATDESIDEASR